MTPAVILERTADAFGVSVADLVDHDRAQHLTWARQSAMLLMRYLLPWLSVQDIARALDRDHSTVLSGIRAARARGRQPAHRHYQRLLLRLARELSEGQHNER